MLAPCVPLSVLILADVCTGIDGIGGFVKIVGIIAILIVSRGEVAVIVGATIIVVEGSCLPSLPLLDEIRILRNLPLDLLHRAFDLGTQANLTGALVVAFCAIIHVLVSLVVVMRARLICRVVGATP